MKKKKASDCLNTVRFGGGEFLDGCVRGSNIWRFTAENTMVVVGSDYHRTVNMPQVLAPDTQILVDFAGRQCVLIWPGKCVYYYRLGAMYFDQLWPADGTCFPKSFVPSCGCWFDETNGSEIVVFGSNKGGVMMMRPNDALVSYLIHEVRDLDPILEIGIWKKGTAITALLMSNNGLHVFQNNGNFEDFGHGKSAYLGIGSLERNVEKRMSVTEGLNECKVTVFAVNGLLELSLVPIGHSFRIEQEPKTGTGVYFKTTEFGIFLVDDKLHLTFVTDSTTIKFPINGVTRIEHIGDTFWFIHRGKLTSLRISDLRTLLFRKAIKAGDVFTALKAAHTDKQRCEGMTNTLLVKKNAEIRDVLLTVDWPVRAVYQTICEVPGLVIDYMTSLLEKSDTTCTKQRSTMCVCICNAYQSMYPKSSDAFKEFLYEHAALLGRSVYKPLRAIGFDEGLVAVASKLNDTDYLVSVCQKVSYDHLSRVTDNNVFGGVIARLIDDGHSEEVVSYITNLPRPERLRRISVLIRTLMQTDSGLVAFVGGDYMSGAVQMALFVIGLCLIKDEDGLVGLCLSGAVSPHVLRGYCSYYGCNRAESRVLVEMQMPERAVEVAYSRVDCDYARCILESIGDGDKRKRGYLRLLELTSHEERNEIIKSLESQNMFDFMDLIDFMDDDTPIGALSSMILECVDTFSEQMESKVWTTDLSEVGNEGFLLETNANCCLCRRMVRGAMFVRFPCGHMCHTECVASHIEKTITSMDRRPESVTESCPRCGFLCMPFAAELFNGM